MSDVGRIAGVSHQTVSRVLNEPWRVSTATSDRVHAAIDQLHFRTNTVARALASRRSNTIGMVSTGIALHSHSKRMIAFNEAARAAGYQVSMASVETADRESLLAALEALVDQNVEGIVLIAADASSVETMKGVQLPVPLVYAESSGRSGPNNVSIDQFLGGRIATAHLADLGHRDIVHLAGPDWSLDANERLRGWKAEMESRGLAVRPPVQGDWTADAGYRAAEQILADPEVTAVFAASDQLALGLLHAFTDRAVAVPGAISVIGFDDQPDAAHYHPPLTTMRQDFEQLGRQLMTALVGRLEGDDLPPLPLQEPQLVIRSSTAPPRHS
ncbi:MAG TPA: LacI family DNA-binding transcriptional regulator [Pseudolysinimonas sp.]|jgi:DNA-binding LacI/PurR family transcriptional regulator